MVLLPIRAAALCLCTCTACQRLAPCSQLRSRQSASQHASARPQALAMWHGAATLPATRCTQLPVVELAAGLMLPRA